MAHWNCNDSFKQQKKRNFIYKSSAQNKNTEVKDQKLGRSLLTTQQHAPESAYSSPRKKMRSSYSFYNKNKSDRQEAEDLWNDLPIDAFEDDVLDDFGDDFTAEELCEAAEQTEQQAYNQTRSKLMKIATDLPKENDNGLNEDYFDKDLNLSETLLSKNDHNGFNSLFTSKGAEVIKEESPTEKTAVLFSDESCPTNQVASKSRSLNNKELNNSLFAPSMNDPINIFEGDQKYKVQMKDLQERLQITQNRIKELEENNYEKDGNLKMLQDSLDRLKSEEVKNREKLRNLEEQKKAEINEIQKSHAKTLEQLNSKICFQEQEIKQAKEQRQAAIRHENTIESPKRNKPNNLSNNSVIPTGQSFFEKSLTESRSPKVRKASKLQKSPEKNHNQLKIPVEKEEISNKALEKRLMRMKNVSTSKGSSVEVTQKLFKLPNTELSEMKTRYQAPPFSQSFLPLLRLNLSNTVTDVSKFEENISLQHTFVRQSGTNTTLLSSDLDSHEVCQAIEGIQEMADTNVLTSKSGDNFLKLVNNFKASNILDSSYSLKCGVNLLPILEHHISHYVELRSDKDEENLMNTCPSSPSDTSEMKDKDSVVALSVAFDGAVQSLRCLCVLVKYSIEVCEVLLKSVQIPLKGESKTETAIQNNAAIISNEREQDGASELLCLLFKLSVPQPNEPALVTLVSLGVFESLAKNCPQEHISWFFPRLCDTLLPQCMSKEYGLSTLSVITSILTTSLCHHRVCSQLDDCVLLKIHQGCLTEHVDLPHGNRIHLQLKVVMVVNSILSWNGEALPNIVDCHCSLELLKLLVCLMNKEMIFLEQYSPESVMSDENTSLSLQFLCHGVFLLASLVTYSESSRLLADLRILVGHKYNSLVIGCLRFFKDIPLLRSKNEVLIDLLDESIDEQEVLGEEDGIEDMDVGE